ncbi:TMV resistance protein N-like [Malus domestica]|uniref:TMV resistance protein N-like n=1 Tax=Malus domestica TaxID=3750 RepID=UPI0010AA628E|nr:TMV resistance protein N-like [Malus domestica]XP_028945483.1 TMV resistance protein N-like [Malus domestica]
MGIQLASSSSLPPSWTYDVFLSFRGEDTRFTFTDHLYAALYRNGIDTFIDRHLKRGEEISPAFLKAIEESRISIIVISEKYASSRWCLDELVYILECRRSRQQIVWPVFYKVDPSHVRNQTSSFGDAFTGLECKYKDEEKILLWRRALREAANLSGYTVKEEEYEATFIDKIVTEILVKVLQRTHLNVAKYLVGIQSCVQEMKELLGDKFRIWGSNILQNHTVTRHLVTYNMSYSDIRQLKGFKNLENLKYMNLRGCKFLEKIPDLSGSPNIEYLDLHGCTNLVEIDDSIGFLDKLVTLNLMGCSRLTRFAPRLRLRSLKRLYLHGCTRLESFPEIEDEMESLKHLDIQKSGIRELPSSIAYLTGLAELLAMECENLIGTSLHHLYGLQHLSGVYFNECPKLVTFGKNKMKFDEVSSSSTESQLLSTDLETSQDKCSTYAFPNLYYLYLEGCNLSESDFLVLLDCWSTLTWLDLSRNNFVSLPDCISKFVNLERLNLRGCKRLRKTPQALPPKLYELYLDDCTSLEKISKLPPELHVLHLSNCFRLCGHGVAKLENSLLNEGSLRRSKLEVIYPGNEVPKWFNYNSNHPTTIQRIPAEYDWRRKDFIGGISFPAPIKYEGRGENFVGTSSFKIPLNLQVGDTLLGLVLSTVFEPSNFNYYVIINGTEGSRLCTYRRHYVWPCTNLEAAHVELKLVDLEKKQGGICNVEFVFRRGARIKSCGVHPLLRKEDEWLPCLWDQQVVLGRGLVHLDPQIPSTRNMIGNDNGFPYLRTRRIDLNVPFDIEEEEQEQPSTSDDSQFFLH